MGKTSDQIAEDIHQSRENLKLNLQELETRVRSVTDWRGYAKKHPGAMAAAALAGGVFLSALIGKGGRSRR
jgi:hypothetical protein